MGREVSQLDLGLMLGLNLASVEVTKWEEEGASGPEAVALSYLSQGLAGFRGDLPEWSYQQAFHAKGSRGPQILTRYWWPRFVATIGESRGYGTKLPTVGISGSASERVAEVTAKGRS